MTDDEGFIRAIVASPGDDLPRLVYADWLDERGDPRGAYLRAELEWVLAGATPIVQQKALTDDLDPVWVARVSRPPLGVCCDHLRFIECGPALTEKDIDEIGKWPRVVLPPEYRAFLLNYNGGAPQLRGEYRPKRSDTLEGYVRSFLPYRPDADCREAATLQGQVERYWRKLPSFLETRYEADPDEVHWYHDYIPITDRIDDFFCILLGVQGPYAGRIQLLDWRDNATSYDAAPDDQLTHSLSDFLDRIIPTASHKSTKGLFGE